MTYEFSWKDCHIDKDDGKLVCTGKPKKVFIDASNCTGSHDGMICTVPMGESSDVGRPTSEHCDRYVTGIALSDAVKHLIGNMEKGDYIIEGNGWTCKPDPSGGDYSDVCKKDGSKKDLTDSLGLKNMIIATNKHNEHQASVNILSIFLHLMKYADPDPGGGELWKKFWGNFRDDMKSASPGDVILNGTDRDIEAANNKVTFSFRVKGDPYIKKVSDFNDVRMKITFRKEYMRGLSKTTPGLYDGRVAFNAKYSLQDLKNGNWDGVMLVCFFQNFS